MRLLPAIRAKVRLPKVRIRRGAVADLYALAGIALAVVGIRDIYRPAAWIVAGAYFFALAFGMTRSPK